LLTEDDVEKMADGTPTKLYGFKNRRRTVPSWSCLRKRRPRSSRSKAVLFWGFAAAGTDDASAVVGMTAGL
jgi:hypothetical protein